MRTTQSQKFSQFLSVPPGRRPVPAVSRGQNGDHDPARPGLPEPSDRRIEGGSGGPDIVHQYHQAPRGELLPAGPDHA